MSDPTGPVEPVNRSAKSDSGQPGGIASLMKDQTDLGEPADGIAPIPEETGDIMAYLAKREVEQLRARNEADHFRIQKERMAASGKLLESKLGDQQQNEFLKIHVDALLKLIAAGDTNMKDVLRQVVIRYQKHHDAGIRSTVELGGLIFDFREAMTTEPRNLNPILQGAERIVSRFPDDFTVCKELGLMADQIVAAGDRDSWKRLSQILVDGYKNSGDQTCRNFVARIEGRLQAATSNLDRVIDAIRNNQPGSLNEFRDIVNKVFQSAEVNVSQLRPITSALQWIESTDAVDQAIEANRIVMAASFSIPDVQARKQLRDNCEARAARLDWLGKPFAIEAEMSDGQPFQWPEFSRDAAVAVIFWSPTEPASVGFVNNVVDFLDKNNVRVLAANVTGQTEGNWFADIPSSVQLVTARSNTNEEPAVFELTQRFGISRTPHLILVDHQGIVRSINPSLANLKSEVEKLKK